MKKCKITAMIVVLALGILPLVAQPPQGQGQGQGQRRQMTEEDVKARVDRLAETLEMNNAQKDKIMKYEMEAYKKRQVEMQKFQGDREAMRSYMQEERNKRDKMYEETLDEKQMAKYKEIEEQRRQEMQQRRQQNQQGAPREGERPQRGRG